MFKIGEFSRISQVSVKALRYYDRLGLLKPAKVDRFTSYRYYSAAQLPRLNQILALKDLGFSLAEVARVLNEDVSTVALRQMLRLKEAEIQQNIQQEQTRLQRIQTRLKQLELEDKVSTYNMVVKELEPVLVASRRDVVPTYSGIGSLFQEVYGHLAEFGMGGGCAAIWYDPEYREHDVDGEAVVFIHKPVPANERLKVYELPAATMASTIHHGSYSTLSHAYQALLPWIVANGYEIIGPNREVYLQSGEGQDDESCVTEIQFPVRRREG